MLRATRVRAACHGRACSTFKWLESIKKNSTLYGFPKRCATQVSVAAVRTLYSMVVMQNTSSTNDIVLHDVVDDEDVPAAAVPLQQSVSELNIAGLASP